MLHLIFYQKDEVCSHHLDCEAASSSRAIGSHFPVWSRGILPQISGFLFIGFLLAIKSPGAEVA